MHTDFIRSCLVGLTFVVPVAAAACSSDPALIGGDKNPVDGNGGDTGRPNDAGSGGATGTGGDVPGTGGSSNPGAGGSSNPGTGGAAPRGSGGAAAGGGGGDVCSLPIDRGNCMAIQPRWGFDPTTQDCKMFNYGGCEGNENRFATRVECMARCGELCAPQDARDVGSCEPLRGFKWDGNACVVVSGCSCEGADCTHLATSQEQCRADHAGCPKCSGARNAVLDFIEQNRKCRVAADCTEYTGGCNIPSSDCTQSIYVNKDTPQDRLQSLRATLGDCLGTTCDGPICAKLPNPPDCVLDRCVPGSF